MHAARVLVDRTVPATPRSLGNVADAIDAAFAMAALAPALAATMNVVIEEILTNIFNHAEGPAGRSIRLVVTLDAEGVVAEIADDGPAFDPLTAPPPDLAAGLEHRAVGGLGIHLVRSLMDQVRYRRDGGTNRLTMVKRTRA